MRSIQHFRRDSYWQEDEDRERQGPLNFFSFEGEKRFGTKEGRNPYTIVLHYWMRKIWKNVREKKKLRESEKQGRD